VIRLFSVVGCFVLFCRLTYNHSVLQQFVETSLPLLKT